MRHLSQKKQKFHPLQPDLSSWGFQKSLQSALGNEVWGGYIKGTGYPPTVPPPLLLYGTSNVNSTEAVCAIPQVPNPVPRPRRFHIHAFSGAPVCYSDAGACFRLTDNARVFRVTRGFVRARLLAYASMRFPISVDPCSFDSPACTSSSDLSPVLFLIHDRDL